MLIDAAGNGGSVQLWANSDPAVTRQMFEVHVLGSERMMRALVPAMRVQGGGVIVNFASTVAWVPMPGAAAYSSAKAAVVALSQSLRAELAQHGIDVRVFAPPHTSTEADKDLAAAAAQDLRAGVDGRAARAGVARQARA